MIQAFAVLSFFLVVSGATAVEQINGNVSTQGYEEGSGSLRGSSDRELKRCPRVDFSAPCGRDGRVCFDCICLDGSWTCGLSEAELADASAQVPAVVRPSLCERSNFDRPCRGRHEGRVCGDCTCLGREWVCQAAVADTTTTTTQSTTTTTVPPPPPVVTAPGDGGNQVATTTIAAPQEPLSCSSLGARGYEPCDTPGQQCVEVNFACNLWDEAERACTPRYSERPCHCEPTSQVWMCDFYSAAFCPRCECERQRDPMVEGGLCWNRGQECRNEADGTNCLCGSNNQWSCVPDPAVLPTEGVETTTLAGAAVVVETTPAAGSTQCNSLTEFGGPFFPCTTTGTTCLFDSGNCEAWNADAGTCEPGTAWEASCTCEGAWICDPIPSCFPCRCDHQYVEAEGYCFNVGQQCRDAADTADCTCTGGAWSCV